MSLVQPVATLQRAFEICHSAGHQWHHEQGKVDPLQAEPGLRAPYAMTRCVGLRSNCTSCTSDRIQWYAHSGEVVNRYRYADGYCHKKSSVDDEPAPTKLEWRQRLVVTLFDEEAPAPRQRKRA